MKFKNQIRKNKAILNRGESCLYRALSAKYMGSFKNDDDSTWNHMLLIQQIMHGDISVIEEFVITTTSVSDITFKAMECKPLKGQMQLL